jgi:ADP-heptose:LPS heptosyltransferase
MGTSNKRVLIYRLGSLGDTVVALPAFHKIRDTYPDAEITLLTNHPVNQKAAPLESILGKGYFFNNSLNYPIGTRHPRVLYALNSYIRSLNIDVLIYLTSAGKSKTALSSKLAAIRDEWFFRLAGIKKIIGVPKNKEDFELCFDSDTERFEWEAKRLTRRLQPLGPIALDDDHYWDLRLTGEELEAASLALKPCAPGKPILAISTGTKRQANDWEEHNWLLLLEQLKPLLNGWQLVIIGAEAESARASKCLDAWGNAGVNLCGQTLPRVSAAILKQAAVFIGHDSGPMHLSACVGTPCVAIFSARNFPGQWYPRGNFNKIIYHRTDCAGCGLETCTLQQKKCILSITVAEVQNAVMEIVDNKLKLNK